MSFRQAGVTADEAAPADFRKGIGGVARLAREELDHDPFSGCLFVFRTARPRRPDPAADEMVRRAVTLLPEKYRDVVVVYYFQDKDVAETARAVRLKEGTVKARLHRARKLLERKLRALQHPRVRAAQET